jgi:2-polyprenyl-3-methyl-5-hydroxy-6-metoxy-1,4-benzoquinol methylase
VHFFQRDVIIDGIPNKFDAIICSLFLHHLDENEASHLLRQMADSARYLLLVNDLERSRLGYVLATLGARALTRSRVVHVDGPLSVRAALSTTEALDLAERAGLKGSTVVRRWPCRYLLKWRRP